MSEWNWSAERRTAIGDVANQSLEYAAERLLESRKRVFDAECKAQLLQAELAALKAAHAWIKTSEHPPDADAIVLGYFANNKHFANRLGLARFSWSMNDPAVMSHWQPLPEAPK